MTTAAGMPKPIVDANTQAIIELGSQVGFTGTQMAEALYHPVSAGLDMATSLNVVRDAAKEAQISGASLDDTTYALSGVMKSFNLGAGESSQTMATLNAIVGQGDMRFQDFNQSIKGWAAPAANFGVSIQSVGAALAYMTDRNVPAAQAGTQLGMSMTLMAAPTKQATKILSAAGMAASDVNAQISPMADLLKKAGVTTTQMAADMRNPNGLQVALADLKQHMIDGGVTAEEQAAVISRAFGGGKSGKAIMEMYNGLDGLKQKFDTIGADSTPEKFAAAWEETTKTTRFQFAQLKASFENFGIKIGLVLLPYVDKVLAVFAKFFAFLSEHKTVMLVFAGIIGAILVVAIVALTVAAWEMAVAMAATAWPVLAIIGVVAGLAAGFMYLWNRFEGFRNFWKTAWVDISVGLSAAWGMIKPIFEDIQSGWNALKYTFSGGATSSVADGGIIGFMAKIGVVARNVVTWVRDHWPEIKAIALEVWAAVAAIVVGTVKAIIAVVGTVAKWVRDHWSQIKTVAREVWDVVSAIVVGTVKAIIAVVGTVAKWVRDHWSQIKTVAKFIWDVVSTIVVGTVKVIIAVVKTVVDWVREHWPAIKGTVKAVWDWVVEKTKALYQGIMDWIKPIVDMVRTHWDEIKQVTEFVWNRIVDVFKAILPYIILVLYLAWENIRTTLTIAWDLIKTIIKVAWAVILGIITVARDVIIGVISIFLDIVTGHWSKAWTDMKDMTGKVWNDIWDTGVKVFNALRDGLLAIFNDIKDGIVRTASNIWNAVSSTFKDGINEVIGQVNGFLDVINKIAGAVGLNLNLHINPIGGGGASAPPPSAGNNLRTGVATPAMATGGVVPIGPGFVTSGAQAVVGEGNPAHPEFVIPTDPTYHGRAMRLYSALGEQLGAGMAAGGVIPHLAAGGTTWPAMLSVVQGQFPDALDNSDFRPGDPGFHGLGQALDVGFAGNDNGKLVAASQSIASTFGGETAELIHQTGRNIKNGADVGDGYGFYGADTMAAHLDHTHWAMDHDPGGGGKGLLGTIGSAVSSAVSGIRHLAARALNAAWPTMPVPQNMLGMLPATANKLRDGVISFVGGQSPGGGGGGTGVIPTGDHLALIDAALAADGIPRGDWARWEAGMNTLIGRESGWNASAVNTVDSNALAGHPSQGLTQTIPATFDAFRNASLPGGINDPTANIAASINYIRSRYGDISAVQQANANAAPMGYKLGGIMGIDPQRAFEHRYAGGPVAMGQPYVVGEAGPELFMPTSAGTIIPTTGAAAGSRAGGPAFGGSGATVHVHPGAIVIHESNNPTATYNAVRQGLADAVARQ